MSWNLVLTIGAILIVVVVLKRIGLISLAKARTHLKNGAMLVDVRSKSEFESGRITGAVNVPLNDLQNSAQRHLKDKNRVLLLHCPAAPAVPWPVGHLSRWGTPMCLTLDHLAGHSAWQINHFACESTWFSLAVLCCRCSCHRRLVCRSDTHVSTAKDATFSTAPGRGVH